MVRTHVTVHQLKLLSGNPHAFNHSIEAMKCEPCAHLHHGRNVFANGHGPKLTNSGDFLFALFNFLQNSLYSHAAFSLSSTTTNRYRIAFPSSCSLTRPESTSCLSTWSFSAVLP